MRGVRSLSEAMERCGQQVSQARHQAQADETKDPFSDDWKKEHMPEDDSWKSVKQELIYNNGSEPETRETS